jgi:hypothetical protein
MLKRDSQIVTTIIILLVVVLAGGWLLQPSYAQQRYQIETTNGEPVRTVSVSGRGQVDAQPDQVIIRLGVQTDAEMAAEALSNNSARMQSLLEALKNAGVPDENIQTQTIRLQPRYQNQPAPEIGGQQQQQQLIGYTASNVVEVRTGDIESIGELIDVAVSAGGNTVEGIRFEVSNPAELLNRAREAAMENARQKAEQLVSLAGAELGNVLTINETTGGPRPVSRGLEMAEAAAVPIQPGSQSLTVDVQVTWLLQ